MSSHSSQHLVIAAELFARNAHAGQTYDGQPYAEAHLAEVVKWLNAIVALDCPHWTNKTKCDALQAAWLHDVVEDTSTGIALIRSQFGTDVADLVEVLTDAPGRTRAARKRKTYPIIRVAGEVAVAIKLADRIANVYASLHGEGYNDSQKHRDTYVMEQTHFSNTLRIEGELRRSWNVLEHMIDTIRWVG